MYVQLKKTKKGTIVAEGPFSAMRVGDKVKAEVGSEVVELTIQALGKPFKKNGSVFVYGYFSAPRSGAGVSIQESMREWVDRQAV